MTAEAGQDSPLAAMISTVAEGQPVTPLDKSLLRLQLVNQARDRGLSWQQIGSLYGKSGREMKREVHKLTARVQRELMAAKGGGGRPVAVPHTDFDTPTGNPQVRARQGYGLTSLRTRKG